MSASGKIFLIGMPGSGKSTLGYELAGRLAVPFVDLDSEVEKIEGTSIARLFETKGEDYFRVIENRLLKTLSNKYEAFVMATGGGAPCFYEAIKFMLENGKVLFIDVPVDELASRIKTNIASRPKFGDGKELLTKIKKLAAERYAVYKKAHHTFSGVNIDVNSLMRQLGAID